MQRHPSLAAPVAAIVWVLAGMVVVAPAPEVAAVARVTASEPVEPVVQPGMALHTAEQRIDQYYGPSVTVEYIPEPGIPPQVGAAGALVVTVPNLPQPPASPDTSETYKPTVRVVVTVGSRVPDVRGLSGTAAEEALLARGLQMRPSPLEWSPEWVIDEQSPPPGTLLRFNEIVEVVFPPVSTTSTTETTSTTDVTTGMVVVPRLVGMTLDAAHGKLGDDLQLRVEEASGGEPRRVNWQRPQPGTEVERGSVVRVGLVGEAAVVVVPDVRGLAPDAAADMLGSRSLKLRAEPSDTSAVLGGAVRQAPQAGKRVPSGTVVEVWFEVVQGGGSMWWPWLAGVLAVAALGLVVARALRARKASLRRVRLDPRPDRQPTVVVGATGEEPDLSLRVEPHADRGRQDVEEVPR
jgi:beta-lactam-binding protein with PASTA domain